jgi:hypothetical protein
MGLPCSEQLMRLWEWPGAVWGSSIGYLDCKIQQEEHQAVDHSLVQQQGSTTATNVRFQALDLGVQATDKL